MKNKALNKQMAAKILSDAAAKYTAEQKSQLHAIRPALADNYEHNIASVEIDDDNYIPYDAGVVAGIQMALGYLFPENPGRERPHTLTP